MQHLVANTSIVSGITFGIDERLDSSWHTLHHRQELFRCKTMPDSIVLLSSTRPVSSGEPLGYNVSLIATQIQLCSDQENLQAILEPQCCAGGETLWSSLNCVLVPGPAERPLSHQRTSRQWR